MLILYRERDDDFMIYFFGENMKLYFEEFVYTGDWLKYGSGYDDMEDVKRVWKQLGYEIIHEE